jgi:hypothetical protein
LQFSREQEDKEMFDQLIVTETESNHIKSRKGYFTVSALVVGIAALVGVVISIFASDFSLGTRDFEMTSLIAPVDMAVAPEPPKPRLQPQQQNSTPSQAKLPMRTDHIQNIMEPPREAPPHHRSRRHQAPRRRVRLIHVTTSAA